MLRKFSGLILYLLITVFVVTIYFDQPAILTKWEMTIYDKLFQLRGKKDASDDILLIGIDDIATQGDASWPWQRTRMANFISKISQQKPQAIFINMPFNDDPRQDSLAYTDSLARAIKTAGNVILLYGFSSADYSNAGFTLPDYIRKHAYREFDDRSKLDNNPPLTASTVYPPTEKLASAAYALGFSGMCFDADRYIRKAPMILNYGGEYLPSVTSVITQTYLKIKPENVKLDIGKGIIIGPRVVPVDRHGNMRINFSGPSRTFRHISADDVVNENIGKKELAGKIVIVAYTGTGSIDLYATPVSKSMHGAEIIANSLESIIHNHLIKDYGSAGMINLLIIIGIGILAAIILPRISLLFRMIALGISLLLIANLSFVLFTNLDIMVKVFYPMIMIMFFMVTAPMMKLYRSGTSDDEDEEIDYEQILSGTPLAGVQTNLNTGTAGEFTQPVNMSGGTRMQNNIATMPIASGKGATQGHQTTNFGRYRVLEPIGQGAMGMVYRGLDPAIDRPVALKTIRLDNIVDQSEMLELKERLTREAKAAGKLSHPNIVTVYDVGEEKSMQYIAMEYLEGSTLESLVAGKHHWDYKTLCRMMIQVCEALDFAHERGVVHRDIKPANIMVLNDERVKVMDFGIARFDQSNMTQSGVALGTPNYISPEQLKGQPVDRRSDIFSLGVVFYELLTYQKPFKGDTISALIYSILHTNPPPPSELNLDVPRIFDKIVAKALAKDPDLRFQTSREMADILRKLI